jgi:hypothetical protein
MVSPSWNIFATGQKLAELADFCYKLAEKLRISTGTHSVLRGLSFRGSTSLTVLSLPKEGLFEPTLKQPSEFARERMPMQD